MNARRSTFPRKTVIAFAGLIVAAAAGVYAVRHAALYLASPAQAPARADAVFVLGGGVGDRETRAAEIYREGLSGTFVLTGMEDAEVDARVLYLHWRTQLLARDGVPQQRMLLDSSSSNSNEEAANGLRLAKARGWKHVMVVSDPPHMRRVRLLWDKAFAGSGIEVRVVAARARWWDPYRWWKSRKSANFVVQEYIKLAYELF